MHIWHLTYASDGRNPLFPDEAACRKAIRVLGRVAGTSTVLFNIVDDHLHLVLWCDRQRRGRLARALVQALRQVASVPVEPARVRAVENRAHMKWLVDYLLSQTIRHGIPTHSALWSGSCFPDLIGARWVPGLELQLRKALPRFRMRDIYRAVGLTAGPFAPLPLEGVRSAGMARLASATGAALAVGPILSGKSSPVVHARRAVAQLANQAGMGIADVAWALDIAPRSVRRLHGPRVDAGTTKAVRMRLTLENAVQPKQL
jgi:REP element-mobilizing transposase RayT